ncbi:MAG: hypothetical protein M1820_008500 [Bogoriella megaspora]|nr:MAG: hypothetical protein M1820_008500 [Bogoriella megaspora]
MAESVVEASCWEEEEVDGRIEDGGLGETVVVDVVMVVVILDSDIESTSDEGGRVTTTVRVDVIVDVRREAIEVGGSVMVIVLVEVVLEVGNGRVIVTVAIELMVFNVVNVDVDVDVEEQLTVKQPVADVISESDVMFLGITLWYLGMGWSSTRCALNTHSTDERSKEKKGIA